MKERPILFSAPMVLVILDGRKTMTRRIVKPQPHDGRELRCPFGQPGDRLWVRETWAAPHAYNHLLPRMFPQEARIHYAATEERGGLLWRSSIHMPRLTSRITLEIVSIRVERLQDISEEDAISEGIKLMNGRYTFNDGLHESRTAKESYNALWRSINGPGSWDANPWVWVVEFKRIEQAGKAEGRQG